VKAIEKVAYELFKPYWWLLSYHMFMALRVAIVAKDNQISIVIVVFVLVYMMNLQ
jgi:hypothetical protein